MKTVKTAFTKQAGFAHIFVLVLLAIAIPLSVFAISKQVYKRGRAQVTTGPCTQIACPSPTPPAAGAALYLSPSRKRAEVNTEFPVQIRVTTSAQSNPVNAIEAKVVYSPQLSIQPPLLDVVRIDGGGSDFTVVAQELVNSGTITIGRGSILAQSGDKLVATIVFRATTTIGAQPIFFDPSQVISSVTNVNILTATTGSTIYVGKVGDLNFDDKVNVVDLSILLTRFGTTDAIADINFDDKVTIVDLSTLLTNYGR